VRLVKRKVTLESRSEIGLADSNRIKGYGVE